MFSIAQDWFQLSRLFVDVCFLLRISPMTYAWHGGRMASLSQDFARMIVTKEQYDEHGVAICLEAFS